MLWVKVRWVSRSAAFTGRNSGASLSPTEAKNQPTSMHSAREAYQAGMMRRARRRMNSQKGRGISTWGRPAAGRYRQKPDSVMKMATQGFGAAKTATTAGTATNAVR